MFSDIHCTLLSRLERKKGVPIAPMITVSEIKGDRHKEVDIMYMYTKLNTKITNSNNNNNNDITQPPVTHAHLYSKNTCT